MNFQTFQREFGLYLRDSRHSPRPAGVPARRAGVYRELLFNNVRGVVEACFPVSRAILGERRWQQLLKRFFVEWRSQTPLFCELPREFLRWLNQADAPGLPPYLPDLMHYEWAELAVDIMQTPPLPAFERGADLLAGRPVLAPAHLLLSYAWPVQRIGTAYRPRKPVPTQLVVFRDASDAVQFALINPVTARLLALLADGELSGEAACLQVAVELQHPDPSAVVQAGAGMLGDLQSWGVIYGCRV